MVKEGVEVKKGDEYLVEYGWSKEEWESIRQWHVFGLFLQTAVLRAPTEGASAVESEDLVIHVREVITAT